ASVRVRVCAHAARAFWRKFLQLRNETSFRGEELFGFVAPEPRFELSKMVGLVLEPRERHLVRAPRPFDRFAVDFLRAGPPFRRSQNKHWPDGSAVRAPVPCLLLNVTDTVQHAVKRCGHLF